MRRPVKWILALLGLSMVAGTAAFTINPVNSLYLVLSSIGNPSELDPLPNQAPGIKLIDDYFLLETIDDQTFAIAEPRYWQKNISYLIIGKDIAVLFDTGPGIRDIKPVVQGLTNLPVLVIPSHLHYDHVGGLSRFDKIGLIDLPQLRKQVDSGGYLQLDDKQHLGSFEKIAAPSPKVDRWLAPNSEIDLGERTLKVLATPGHTPDSLMLYDSKRRQLFTGDFIYSGKLLAMLPGGDLGQYHQTSKMLSGQIAQETSLFPGHNPPGTDPWQINRLTTRDLADLDSVLMGICNRTISANWGVPPKFEVNSDIELWTPYSWNFDCNSR